MFQLLQSRSAQLFDPVLVTDKATLRSPRPEDYEAWLTLRRASRAHLIQWEEDWVEADVSFSAYRRRLRLWERHRRQGAALSLFAFGAEADAAGGDVLVGGVTLTSIRYGAARSGILGYWIGTPFLRRGYASAAVGELAAHAFGEIGLNRLEAACQRENGASAQLLGKLGFRREGTARSYLRINGAWRDHDIYALTAGDWANGACG
jgi:ribosomal-protein-alanine N-acetyltransferase